MHLGRQPRIPFPETYQRFRLLRTHGRVFGIPFAIDPDDRPVHEKELLLCHPHVLSAATLDEMRERIDAFDESVFEAEVVARVEGADLVRLGGAVHTVPDAAAG